MGGGRGNDSKGIGPGTHARTDTGSLTIGWTNVTDFVHFDTDLDQVSFADGKAFVFDGTKTLATLSNFNGKKIVAFELPAISGEGTKDSPYLISSTDEWVALAYNVNNGHSYSGEYVKLTADISTSTMVGLRGDNPFSGTFLGDGHTITASIRSTTSGSGVNEQGVAPFHYIKDATIKDLTVAGTIASASRHTSGLVGFATGTNVIENCAVTATLNISSDYAGGIIGHGMSSETIIQGCVFAGTINGVGGNRANIGGIWGWSGNDYGFVRSLSTFIDCLESGTYNNIASMHPMGLQIDKGTITNCYYLNPKVGNPDNACTLIGAAPADAFTTIPANLGDLVKDYGLVKAYENGIFCDGKYYMVPSLAGSGTELDPYIISNAVDWLRFCANVANANQYSGKYVQLTNNITVYEMAGTSEGKSFQGTFLGDGYTITASISNANVQGVAPFHYIKDATIKNLKVAGTIASDQRHTSGLVGFAAGTNVIENCVVTATLNISSDYAGGIVGHGQNSNTTIQGCVFAGTINGVGGNRNNIGGIWGWSDSGTPTIVDCLEAGTYTHIASMHPMGLKFNKGTITNCYYLNPQVGSPSSACTVSGTAQAYAFTTAPANLGNLVQDYGMVKAYANGILYDGKCYVAPATVSLADAADNSTTISNANGYFANVTLTDRTLYKDGKWNTICLPFDVTLSGSPLAGATARPLTTASISSTTLNLTFGEPVTELVAGTPYIIKWEKADGYVDDDAHNLVSPIFNGVTIDATDNSYDSGEADGDQRVRFLGTYKSTAFDAEDRSILFMGGDNKLYYPQSGTSIGAQRAYFKIGDGASQVKQLTAFSIDFGEDEATGIGSLTPDPSPKGEGSDYWYSLDGRQLQGKPSRAGVYINNGVKRVIK